MTSTPMGHTYVPATSDAPGTVALEVRHLDTDSYTRSVDRAAIAWATRKGHQHYPGHAWAIVDGAYGVREIPAGGPGSNGRPWSVSVLTFRLERVAR